MIIRNGEALGSVKVEPKAKPKAEAKPPAKPAKPVKDESAKAEE